ncbi:MAG TPA: ABC transporter ATP-binding protein [Solirubrobacterales bacterium]|nr:ABC transporter ATP-binding protein [Solirubrobacterales bacterium]
MASSETARDQSAPKQSEALLDVTGLGSAYGRRQVVFDVSLEVREGEVVTILGHNGAGKTTTMKTIFGLMKPVQGRVTYAGKDVVKMSVLERVRSGMCFVPPQHFVFADLSVIDNLLLGAQSESSAEVIGERLQRVHELFPILKERHGQAAGTMSGGQQRILSIGTALMSGPKLILLDEPSLGLAPVVFQEITEVLRQLVAEHQLSVLLLEQNVQQALTVADRVYVMRSGRTIMEESAEEMRAREHWWDLF